LFSLLDEIETTWVGPPTTIHRRIRAVFSRTAWEVISEPRTLPTVDLAVLRALGPRRELARRLFYLLEAQPGHELGRGVEVVERLVDPRLRKTTSRCDVRRRPGMERIGRSHGRSLAALRVAAEECAWRGEAWNHSSCLI
jgi:hypothetical protein